MIKSVNFNVLSSFSFLVTVFNDKVAYIFGGLILDHIIIAADNEKNWHLYLTIWTLIKIKFRRIFTLIFAFIYIVLMFFNDIQQLQNSMNRYYFSLERIFVIENKMPFKLWHTPGIYLDFGAHGFTVYLIA